LGGKTWCEKTKGYGHNISRKNDHNLLVEVYACDPARNKLYLRIRIPNPSSHFPPQPAILPAKRLENENENENDYKNLKVHPVLLYPNALESNNGHLLLLKIHLTRE